MKKLLIFFLLITSVAYGQVELPFGILNKNAGGADTKYGPYANLAAAKTGVPLALRYDGCTVKIIGDGEYQWLSGNFTDAGLVRKSVFVPLATSSVSGTVKLYTSTGNSTDGTMDRNSITNTINSAAFWKTNAATTIPADIDISDNAIGIHTIGYGETIPFLGFEYHVSNNSDITGDLLINPDQGFSWTMNFVPSDVVQLIVNHDNAVIGTVGVVQIYGSDITIGTTSFRADALAAAGSSAIVLADNGGLLTSSTALPAGTTAQTQSISDNSTKVVTTAFAQNLAVADHTYTGVQQFKSSNTSSPSVIFPTGTGPTSPVNGWMWYDGSHLYFRNSSSSIDLLAAGGGTVTSITATSPLTGGSITSSGNIGISDAVANGTGKGAATFEAADFNSSAGDISIDYTNAQKATTSQPGFLTATDWNTFNGKGTVTSMSIVTANGISGSVATSTSTPAVTLTLGNITPTSIGSATTATTQSAFDNSTKLATTAYADNIVGNTTVTTLGTITTGTWHANSITVPYGGTGQSSLVPGDIWYGSAVMNITAKLGIGSANQSMIVGGSALPVWSSINIVDLVSASTAGSTVTLDLNSQYQRMYVGSATFATGKTLALVNTTNTRVFDFHFEVTNVAATLTMPSGWLMSDVNFASHIWTPPSTGKFELTATYDGNFWKVKIAGPFL